MITSRRPATVALCAIAVLTATWSIAASAGAGDNPDAQEASRLVQRTRDAALHDDFTGEATVTWTTTSGTRRARVHVTGAEGAIEIVAVDGNTVIDEGRRTYLRNALGWTGIGVEPTAGHLPGPGSHWDLATGGTRTVAGRPATVVVAVRSDGAPAQRLAVDNDTGLLLAREVVGPNGEVQRSVRFSSIEIGAAATSGTIEAPSGVRNRTAQPLASVPGGYRAPGTLDGYELVTRSRHPDGVLLFYSDGLFTASVFEQQGDLDWGSLPAGGTDSEIAGTRARTYHEPSGDVVVWARDGLVYTCVSDAPSDVSGAMVRSLVGGDRSAPESVVDFVLGPFGWG
jgi:hypothetical protein